MLAQLGHMTWEMHFRGQCTYTFKAQTSEIRVQVAAPTTMNIKALRLGEKTSSSMARIAKRRAGRTRELSVLEKLAILGLREVIRLISGVCLLRLVTEKDGPREMGLLESL